MADYAIHEETLTDVADVIRKKDGTSALIDPADYADRINLMGMLEEKTVSGAIVTFPDGADAVPLKKCEITLPASLDGYSSVDVKHTSKNILPNMAQTATENDVTFTVNSDGTVSLSGTCSADTNFYIYSGFTFPKLGQYFFSGCPSGGSTSTFRVFLTNYGADVGNGYLLNVSNLSTTTSIRINIKAGVVTDGLVFKPQIEAGSTGTTFVPYTAPTTYTATLGRTIYGGTADIVNGQGKAYGRVELGSLSWVKVTSGQAPYFASGALNPSYNYVNNNPNALVEGYTQASIGGSGTTNGFFITDGSSVRIRDDNYTSGTADEFKEAMAGKYVVYELATPEDFTFDSISIDSKLGNNTIWSEQGSSAEVTYRGQGTTTPILPTLVTKTITENGTYSAEDDDADGYSEVTVNVPTGGEEIPFTHVFTAGTATDQYYTASEDGIYLAVGIRDQSTGCSINLPDGGTTLLTSSLLSNRAQMKVVQLTAGQRIHLYLYDSSHMRGGWIFKLNTTTPTLAYSNGYSSASIPNHGTTDKVLSVIALAPTTDNTTIWDKTMMCYVRGTYNVSNRFSWLRLMYGIDNEMPTISFSGGIGGQWLINLG